MQLSKLKTSILLSYICIASASAAIVTPALPQIERSYHLAHGAVEWVVSIFLLGYVFGQLIYAPLANRIGRLSALRTGLVINLIGILLCIISLWFANFSLLLTGRLITALGSAAGLSCTFILLNELLGKAQAKRAMSFASISFTIGIGTSVTLGGLLTQYLHWHYCFWILMIHGVVMLSLTWLFPETLERPAPLCIVKIASGYWSALQSKTLIAYSLAIGLVSAVAYCYSAAAPLYAASKLHLSPSMYGYWNLINMLGMLASGYLSAALMKHKTAKQVLSLGLGLMAPCLLSLALLSLSAHATALWFFTTTMLLYCIGGIIFPAASFLASNAIEDKANASSMMSFINMASAMVAVIVMGYLPMQTIIAFAVILITFYAIVCCVRQELPQRFKLKLFRLN